MVSKDEEMDQFLIDLENGKYDFPRKEEPINKLNSKKKTNSNRTFSKRKKFFVSTSVAVVILFSRIRTAEAMGNSLPHKAQILNLYQDGEDVSSKITISKVKLNSQKEPKIALTESDLRNSQWIKEFIFSIKGGSQELDEQLIESILSKVSDSNLSVPSINKIILKISDAVLSIASNEKLLRILKELENPIARSPLTLTFSDDLAKIPTNLQAYQNGPRSSSSILVEGFNFPSFSGRHRKQTEIDWKKKNVVSTPSAACLLDSTKCYGHREAYDMPRSVSERFETNAVRKLAKTSLKNPLVKKEYGVVQDLLKEGVHPINLSEKSSYVSSTKVLVKKGEGRYLVDVSDTNADIVGISSRTDKKCMAKFEKLMNKLYDLNLEGY